MNTNAWNQFDQSIWAIQQHAENAEQLIVQLLLVNLITSLEVYLHDVLLEMIRKNGKLALEVASSGKLGNIKIPLSNAININAIAYISAQLSSISFHNLAEVEPYFSKGLSLEFVILDEVLNLIDIRHDVVHRNGFLKTGAKNLFEESSLVSALCEVKAFVYSIELQITTKYNTFLT